MPFVASLIFVLWINSLPRSPSWRLIRPLHSYCTQHVMMQQRSTPVSQAQESRQPNKLHDDFIPSFAQPFPQTLMPKIRIFAQRINLDTQLPRPFSLDRPVESLQPKRANPRPQTQHALVKFFAFQVFPSHLTNRSLVKEVIDRRKFVSRPRVTRRNPLHSSLHGFRARVFFLCREAR